MSAKHSERLPVSQAEVDAFHADGAVVLRQLLEEHEVELLRAGIDENLAHPSPRAKVASAPGDPGFFLEDFWCWQDNERYRQFIFASALGEVGARLMRSTTAPSAWKASTSACETRRRSLCFADIPDSGRGPPKRAA